MRGSKAVKIEVTDIQERRKIWRGEPNFSYQSILWWACTLYNPFKKCLGVSTKVNFSCPITSNSTLRFLLHRNVYQKPRRRIYITVLLITAPNYFHHIPE